MSEPSDVKTIKCPNCGTPVSYDSISDTTVRCPYCGTSTPVPDELRPQQASAPRPHTSRPGRPTGCSVTGITLIIGIAVIVIGIIIAILISINLTLHHPLGDVPEQPEAQVAVSTLSATSIAAPASWYISGAPDPRWDDDMLVTYFAKLKGSDFEAVDESSLMVNPDSAQVPDHWTYVPLVRR
jgi:endogenous inhibitor of DNA gyrase (YacG/DUF329 family)